MSNESMASDLIKDAKAENPNFEVNRLKQQLEDQAKTISHMRDTYWALSRRLKYFANDFCPDLEHAGAIRFIVNESNYNWTMRRRDSEPSDSEIPF